jgi:hypothetical protein
MTLKSIIFAALLALSCENSLAANSATELAWSSFHLEGVTLQLVSPKSQGFLRTFQFGKRTLLIKECSAGTCKNMSTSWKIQNNRLIVGDDLSEGDALVDLTANTLTLRKSNGRLYVYSFTPRSGT